MSTEEKLYSELIPGLGERALPMYFQGSGGGRPETGI